MLAPLFVALDLSRCLATLKVIPVTRRPIFNVSAISSTSYKVWKKSFHSIVEMDNLYYILVENVIAEMSNFVQVFALLLGAFFAFNIEYPKKLETTLLFFQKFILRVSDRSYGAKF